jgi:hypothetical protein
MNRHHVTAKFGAFGAALLVLAVHRVILPRFGVRIGTEFAPHGD